MIHWETVKEDFQWDGSLRDICITPATIDDWRIIYPLLTTYAGVEFSVDGMRHAFPAKVDAIFDLRSTSGPALQIRAGRIAIVFHFFTPGEIECDFDSREVSSQADLDALLGFVRQLGKATQKRVIITPENLRENPIVSYSVKTDSFKYHEAVC